MREKEKPGGIAPTMVFRDRDDNYCRRPAACNTQTHREKINEFKTVYGLHCLVWRRLSFFTNFRPTTNFIEAIFICYLYSLTIRIGPAVYI
jgi:hypothetical protein